MRPSYRIVSYRGKNPHIVSSRKKAYSSGVFTTPTSAGTMACYFIIFSFLLKWPPSLFSALPFPTHTTQKCLLNFLRCLRPIGLVHFANIMLVHIISGSNYWCKRNGKSDSAVRKWTMSANSFAPQ